MDYIKKYKDKDIYIECSRKKISSLMIICLVVLILVGFICGGVWECIFILVFGLLLICSILEQNYWSIIAQNNALIVRTIFQTYYIPFKDLINVRSRYKSGYRSGSGGNAYRYLEIKYKKNKSIRTIALQYMQGRIFKIEFVPKDKIYEFIRKFSSDESLKEEDGYFDIRTEEETREFEEILRKTSKRNIIISISAIIIIPAIVLYFLIWR